MVRIAAAFDDWPTTTPGSRRAVMVASGWAAAFALFGFFGTRGAALTQPGHRPPGILGYVLAIGAGLLLSVVWLWPRPVFAVTVVLVTGYLARYYPGGPIYLVGLAAAAVLGWREPIDRSIAWVAGAGVAIAAAGAFHLQGMGPLLAAAVVIAWLLFPVVPWCITELVQTQRRSSRQEAASRLRLQQDEERIRMAREVHDGVGHRLAVISMQAGVALHVADRRPEQARVALEAIVRSSRDALAELRTTLAVVRGEPAPRSPAHGVADVPALVDDLAATGQPVTLTVRDLAEPLPPPCDVTVYRIVQESLTNAARHAPRASTQVVISAAPGVVVVDVCNERSAGRGTPGMGTGLAGMRERCAALGGTLTAGPASSGGWAVHAEVPTGAAGAS